MTDTVEKEIPGVDAVSRAFGNRVRSLREQRNLTLDAFSRRSGVSRAMLSKVERGEKSPTIGVAKRISHALGTPLSVLMGDEGGNRAFALVKKSQRQVFRDPETGFERHLLTPIVAGMAVEVVLHYLPANTSTGILPPYPGGAGKFVVATKGRVTVGFDNEEVEVNEGDSLYFEANTDHFFKNTTETDSEYYLVISAPSSNH